MSDLNVLFPIPTGGRNADDMGLPESTFSANAENTEMSEKVSVPEVNQWPDTQPIEPVTTNKWQRMTNKQRKSTMRVGINVCHYCRTITNEPLRVERELDGRRLKLENHGMVYYHKSCKVRSLMENQNFITEEETEIPSTIESTEPQ